MARAVDHCGPSLRSGCLQLSQLEMPMILPLLFALQQSVTRVVVTPARPVVSAGDTMRLSAQALDANGKAIADARIRFQSAGGVFEGSVDSLGLVTSGSTGTLPVVAVAIVPGARP